MDLEHSLNWTLFERMSHIQCLGGPPGSSLLCLSSGITQSTTASFGSALNILNCECPLMCFLLMRNWALLSGRTSGLSLNEELSILTYMSSRLHLLHTHLEPQAAALPVPWEFCEVNDDGFLLLLVFVVPCTPKSRWRFAGRMTILFVCLFYFNFECHSPLLENLDGKITLPMLSQYESKTKTHDWENSRCDVGLWDWK